MTGRKRGRPFKGDDDVSKKVNFLKKPKYLSELKKDEKVELFLNNSVEKQKEIEINKLKQSRRRRTTRSRRKKRKQFSNSLTKFKNVSSSAYYQQFRSYNSTTYDYSGQESEEFENSNDGSSSYNEAENTSVIDNLSEAELALSDNNELDSDDSGSSLVKKSASRDGGNSGNSTTCLNQNEATHNNPIWLQNRTDIPELKLPFSSNDLLLEPQHLLDAVAIYEVLRRFSSQIRLTPFRFEDFCTCLVVDEQSVLLAEIHIMLLKAIIHEDELRNTCLTVPDQKDSVNISIFLMDSMTWPEVLRLYIESDKQFDQHVLSILNQTEYPFVPISSRLDVLKFLVDQFLCSSAVRNDFNVETQEQSDNYCRVCHKLGDLLCCDTCLASFHLKCIDPPLYEVPESDWQCDLCKLHIIEGVSECYKDQERGLSRLSSLGYDRHGRKYYFMVRRIIIESLDTEQVWYYSVKEQFDKLLMSLDEQEFEEDLVAVLKKNRDEICRQMQITLNITNSLKNGRKSYLDSLGELVASVNVQNDTNFDWNKEEIKNRLEQINKSQFLYKLGMESSCKQYINHYLVNVNALNKLQRNEERDKKRFLSHKFSLTPASEFKWAGSTHGSKSSLVNTLRSTILYFENTIPMIFMHINWPFLRKTWLQGVSASLMPADFSRILLILESCMKRVIFANVWHDQVGHLRLQRMSLVEREERKKTEKREKREKDEEEERNRLTYNYCKFPSGLKHQVWKQKGEEYRIHGQWGWLWLSSAYRLKGSTTCQASLRISDSYQMLVQVENTEGQRKCLLLNQEQYQYLKNFQSSVENISDIKTEEKMDVENDHDQKPLDVPNLNNSTNEESIEIEKSDTHKEEFKKKFMNYKIVPQIQQFEEMDVNMCLSSSRIPYPKIARKSKLDDLLYRRTQLKIIEERKLLNKTEENQNQGTATATPSSLNNESKNVTNGVQKSEIKPEVFASITKRIHLLRAKYTFVAKSLSKYKCYSHDCTAEKNAIVPLLQSCYSPVCMLRTRLRKELLVLLKEINYQSANMPRFIAPGITFNKKNSILEQKLRQKIPLQKKQPLTIEEIQKTLLALLDKTPVYDEEKFKCAFRTSKNVPEIKDGLQMEVTETDNCELKNKDVDLDKLDKPSTSKDLQIFNETVQSLESNSKPEVVDKSSRVNRRFNSDVKLSIKDAHSNNLKDVKNEQSGEIYSSNLTSGKIYLKKVEIGDRRRSIPIKIPKPTHFLTKKGTHNILALPRHRLLKLARKGGHNSVHGFQSMSKSNHLNWPYPCPKPLFKTCWLYRSVTLNSIAAVCLQLRIMWACIRWDDLETKPPPDGKNQVTTETEIITYEILKHRLLGEFLDRTQYLRRKQIVPLEAPSSRNSDNRDYTAVRLGLRKRRQPEFPQITEPQTIEEWIDEERFELWELRLYAEKNEKNNNQVITRSRTGNLPQTRLATEIITIDKSSPVLGRILASPFNPTVPNSIIIKKDLNLGEVSLAVKSSEEIKQECENVYRMQCEVSHNKRNYGQLVKVITAPTQSNMNINETQLKLVNRIRLNPNNQTLNNILQNDSSKGNTPVLLKCADQTVKLVQPISQNVNQPNTNKLNQQMIVASNQVQILPKIQIIKNTGTGQIQIRGLAPNQHAIAQNDGSIHIVTKNIDNKSLTTKSPVVGSSQQVLLSKVQKSNEIIKTDEENLTRDQPPGTIACKITVQVIETVQGQHGILTQGLNFNEYTSNQLTDIQTQIKNKLHSAQAIAGTQTIKDPLEMVIFVKPDNSSARVRVVKQLTNEVSVKQTSENKQQMVVLKATDEIIAQNENSQKASDRTDLDLNTKSESNITQALSSVNNKNTNIKTSSIIVNNHIDKLSNPKPINVKEKLKETVNQKILEDKKLPTARNNSISSVQNILQLPTKSSSTIDKRSSVTPKKRYNSLRDDVDYVPGPLTKRRYTRKKTSLKNLHDSDDDDLDEDYYDDDDDDYEKSRGNFKYKSDSDSEASTSQMNSSSSLVNSFTEQNNNDDLTSNSRRQYARKDQQQKLNNRKYNRRRKSSSNESGDFSCYCETPYDETKFYVGCDICHKWFHGDCVDIDEEKSKVIHQFVCKKCEESQKSNNELYCLCREPYDDKQFYICCDKCQDWFHGRCVNILQSEAPKIDVYICPNCDENSSFLQVNQKVLINEDYCDIIKFVKQLQLHKNSWPFREPVVSEEVPEYYDIIQNPMDLKTLEDKLTERAYKTLSDFIKDAVKIFDNCRYFNPKESSFYKCAESLETFFISKLRFVRERLLERLYL